MEYQCMAVFEGTTGHHWTRLVVDTDRDHKALALFHEYIKENLTSQYFMRGFQGPVPLEQDREAYDLGVVLEQDAGWNEGVYVPTAVNTDLTSPCQDCPFRKSSAPGWLGPWEPDQILHEAIDREGFVCHRTVNTPQLQWCAGAALMLNRTLKISRDRDYAAYQKLLKSNPIEIQESVFGSRDEFLVHHVRVPVAQVEDDPKVSADYCTVMDGPHCVCVYADRGECCFCDRQLANCLDDEGDDDE